MDAKTGKSRSLIVLALSIAFLVSLALVSGRFHVRLDLSADRVNSLSSISRNLYKEVPESLRLSYYISGKLAARYPQIKAVEDFLRELEAASRGKIAVEILDPDSEDMASRAQAMGLRPQNLQIVERNEQRMALVYSGIVLRYLDRSESIAFVSGTDTLEYDLVKKIRSLVSDKKSVAALLIGDADKSLDNDYRALSETLARSGWEARLVNPGDAVPPEAQVLIVIGNSDLDDYAVYRIDEYLAGGGRAFMALKGVEVEAYQTLRAAPLRKDAIVRALANYGLGLRPELALDKFCITIPYQQSSPYGGGFSLRYLNYPFWIVTRPAYRDRQSPLTARISGLDLFWPSPLDILPREGVEAKALVRTSPEAWLQTKNFAVSFDAEPLYAEEQPGSTGQYILAATLSGVLPPAYAGLPIPAREGAAALKPLPAAPRASRIVVVGSSDFANDLMMRSDSLFNAGFIADAVEWLASGDELVSLKNRGAQDIRMGKDQSPTQKSLYVLLAYVVNLVLIPGALLAWGLSRAASRRAAARRQLSAESEGEAR